MNPKEYKIKVASRYFPLTPEDIFSKMSESDEYFGSEKLDGVFAGLIWDKKKPKFLSGSGSELPFQLTKPPKLPDGCILYGELYPKEKDRAYHFDVTKLLAESPEKLMFHVFDVILEKPHQSIAEKQDWLKKYIKDSDEISLVSQTKLKDKKAVLEYFQKLDPKAEGSVVVTGQGAIYKIKRKVNLDLIVLGYSLGYGNDSEVLRDLLLGIKLNDSNFQIIGLVGNGLADKERAQWKKLLEKDEASSDFIEVSGSKTAYQFVQPKYVIEIDCLDVINDTTSGLIQKPCLAYSEKKKTFEFSAFQIGVSLLGASFLRERKDKEPNEKDAGLKQISHFLSVAGEESKTSQTVDSILLERAVYTKEAKGKTSVRKFILCESKKEKTHAPFFVLYSDFSPERKDPLQQDIIPANNKKSAESILKSLIEENIKKGWEKVS